MKHVRATRMLRSICSAAIGLLAGAGAARAQPTPAHDTLTLRRPPLLQVSVPDPPRRESARRLPCGRTAVIRIYLTIEFGGTVPRRLTHRFTFAPIADVRIARTPADTDATPVITTSQGV